MNKRNRDALKALEIVLLWLCAMCPMLTVLAFCEIAKAVL
jgi:hypothetical protein